MTRDLTAPRLQLIKPFYASFDGLRACAFLGVFTWHIGRTIPTPRAWLNWGWTGVDLFFVLSGFLITGILLDATAKPHFFKTFYSRRALRIFPAYYTFWIVVLLLTPLFHFQWNRYVVTTVFYFGNFFCAGFNLNLHPNPGVLNFTFRGSSFYLLFVHFWSLAIEEQFYLVWPAIIWFVRSRRTLLSLCIVGIVAAPCLRIAVLHFHPEQLAAGGLYYSTYARFDTLLAGAALALWLRLPGRISFVSIRRYALIALAGSLLALAILLRFDPHPVQVPILDDVVCTVGFTLIAIASGALLIYSLFEQTFLSRLLQWQPLRFIGRLSYGMYLYHEILLPPLGPALIVLKRHHLAVLYPFLAFALTLIVAYLSFRFIESPFLRLKHGLAPRPGAVPDPPPAFSALVAE